MKVTLKRTRKGAMSIAFRAEDDEDGVNLKDAVLASVKNGGGFDLEALINELGKTGYEIDGVEEKKAKGRA